MRLSNPFMVGAGNFFFRYRAYMFPLIFIAMLFVFRPQVIVNETFSCWLTWLGLAVTLLGEGLRFFTIGFDYIERGGKDGKVNASRLVTGGIYNHVRNPMYLGNILIAIGIGLYGGAPLAFVTVLPFFVFFYYAIMATEEKFLHGKFGEEYEAFCRRTHRLWPSFANLGQTLSGFSFHWWRALIKDSGTAFWTFVALALIPLWREYFLHGATVGESAYTPWAAGIVAALLPCYIWLRILKKNGKIDISS